MLNRFTLTLIVLVLSIAVFVSSSETAARLDHRRGFNYANPTYIVMVIIAVGSALSSALCLIDLSEQAKKMLEA